MVVKLQQLDSRMIRWDFTRFKTRNCPICDTKNEKTTYLRPDNCEVKSCFKCGCYYISPAPSVSQLSEFYQNYHKDHFGGNVRYDVSKLRWDAENIYPVDDPRLIFLSEDMKIVQSAEYSVLDFGCGTGAFLYQAKLAGAKVSGIELDESAVNVCHQLGLDAVEAGGIDALESVKDRFNLIVLNDVIEHPLAPGILMENLASILAENGKIMIWTPNGDAIDNDRDKVSLRVDLEHMQYLTTGAIKELSFQNDLDIVHYAQLGYPSEDHFIKYKSHKSVGSRVKFALVKIVKFFRLDGRINQVLKFIRISASKNRRHNGNYHLYTILKKAS